jgi:uncharacterized protein (TIGR03083 family)
MNAPTRPVPAGTIPRIRRGQDAARLAAGAYDALLALLDDLEDRDASLPTDCAAWDVGDLVGHLVGAARAHASLREQMRQLRHGQRHAADFDGNAMDAMNDLQVRDHAHLALTQKTAQLRSLAPVAVRRRTRLPRPLRHLPVPLDRTGSMPPGLPSRVPLGWLNEVVLTRDVFLHRVDLARATGRDLPRNETDARIVADVVADWLAAHGRAVEVRLTGPAGGHFVQGAGGPTLELDAIEFCRIVSGRVPGTDLLATYVLF